jgi:hypothetical protein
LRESGASGCGLRGGQKAVPKRPGQDPGRVARGLLQSLAQRQPARKPLQQRELGFREPAQTHLVLDAADQQPDRVAMERRRASSFMQGKTADAVNRPVGCDEPAARVQGKAQLRPLLGSSFL